MTRLEQLNELFKQYNVDETMLHRDYRNNPIKKEGKRNVVAKPDKEDLEYLYTKLGMKAIEIGVVLGGVSSASALRYLNEYNVSKPENTSNRTTSMDTVRDKYVCYELIKDNEVKHVFVKEPRILKDDEHQNIKVNINQFIKVYIEDNLSVEEMMELMDMNRSTVMNIVKFLKLKKDPKRVKENYRKTMQKMYGCENIFQVEEIKEKSKNTMLKKYGARYQQTQEYRDKVFNTKLERYGNGKYQNFKKGRETNMQKYGVPLPSMKKGKEKLYSMLHSDDPTELIAYIKEKGYQSIQDFAYQEEMRPNAIGNAVRKFHLHHLFPNKRSALEIQIQMWISQFDDNLKHSFKMPSSREIDIYDDKLMLGFEVNGNHWHSSTFRSESYHYEKSMEAKSIGYRLIHIYEYEWIARKPQIQGFIKDLYGIYDRIIDFTKCTTKEVSSNEVESFIEENSIYECPQYTDTLGLFYENELVALILLNDLSFGEYEIVRYCKKIGCRIDNWFVKLCGQFIFNNSIKTIYGYSDVVKSDGSEFEQIGFKQLGYIKPRRFYAKYKTIIWERNITYDVLRNHHVKFKKKEAIALGKSPEDILLENTFDHVSDGGWMKWIWKKE